MLRFEFRFPRFDCCRNNREKFPARRELAGNFLENRPFTRVSRRENICEISKLRDAAREIPYAAEQGIISREQGIYSGFWTGAGNRRKAIRSLVA
jgi:hypothetical protein